MAIACLRLDTFFPEPERSFPRFISCIAAPTFLRAFLLEAFLLLGRFDDLRVAMTRRQQHACLGVFLPMPGTSIAALVTWSTRTMMIGARRGRGPRAAQEKRFRLLTSIAAR